MWDQIKRTRSTLTAKKTKMRTVLKSKWELPIRSSKSCWDEVIEDIESKVTKVRKPSLFLFPKLSMTHPHDSISDDGKSELNLFDPNINRYSCEPIVRVSPPSPSHKEHQNSITSNIFKVEHMNYLKSRDTGNFELNFQSSEHSNMDELITRPSDVKCKLIKEDMMNPELSSKINLSPFTRISHLSKITKCVNDFLSSTRVTVNLGSSVIPKNTVSPVQTSRNVRDKCGSYLFTKKTSKVLDIQSPSNEFLQRVGVIQHKGKTDENSEPGASLQKRVGFQNIEEKDDDDDDNIELQTRLRPRAPSLGVASAVPSFGKIVSSLEYSDSVETPSPNGSTPNFNLSLDLPQASKDLPKVPQHKITRGGPDEFLAKQKTLLKVPEMRPPGTSFYPRLRQHRAEAKSTAAQPIRSKELGHSRKSQQWPKKSIVHVLRALKLMKHGEKKKKKIEYEDNLFFASSLPLQVFSPIERSSSSSGDRDFPPDSLAAIDEESVTTSSTPTTCSYKSVRERLIKNAPIHQQRTDLFGSGFMNDRQIKFASRLGRINTGHYDSKFDATDLEEDMVPNLEKEMIPKGRSKCALNEIPQISGMFPRKQGDRCLACLHISMKKLSKDPIPLLMSNQAADLPSSPSPTNSIMDELNIFFKNKLSLQCRDALNSEFASEYSDIPSELFDNNLVDKTTRQNCGLYASPHISRMDAVSRTSAFSHYSEPKQDHGTDKKSIVSSKSFVSTLSLASERSKTISDQDDSDQAIDEAGGMEEGVVKSRSKYLAPCHAPLNLRPSLEALRALRSKKARSIQSRMASLEKSTDAGSDEESDDDEIPIRVAKSKDDNRKKSSSSLPRDNKIENISAKTDDLEQSQTSMTSEEDCEAIGKLKIETESFEQFEISDEIFAKLNVTPYSINQDPSKSFRPLSPVLSEADVMEISKKSLEANKTVVEGLNVIANEYPIRLSKKLSQKPVDLNTSKVERMTKRLLMLLVDSKLYLHPKSTFPDLEFSSKQKPPINSRQLRRVLPVKSYNLIAPLLGIPQWHPKRWSAVKDARRFRSSPQKVSAQIKEQPSVQFASERGSSIDFDLIVHPPSQKESGLSEDPDDIQGRKQLNPYALFLTKPRRKTVTWRPLTERDLEGYDPEATLKKRAAKLTDTICADFCQWLRSLGGFDTTVDEEVLKDMFETDFTAEACRTMQVSIREVPMVPTVIANTRHCPEVGGVEITRKHQIQDAQNEKMPARLIGFGSALPRHLIFTLPKIQVEAKWLRCENVPDDLESMDAVWKDITHLDSVKGFIQWLKAHPQVKPPRALEHVMITRKSQ